MTQDQLNTDIAQELNKWQPIVEYGRLKIDEDNDIRSEYKWLIIFKNSVAGQLISTIIDFVLSQKVSYTNDSLSFSSFILNIFISNEI